MSAADEKKKSTTPPQPQDFDTYQGFLRATREFKNLRQVDVCNASVHPGWPNVSVKKPAISRMEAGGFNNPTFRQMILYARGYGVSLDDLATFFLSDFARAENKS